MLKFKILAEDRTNGRGILAEHGLSMLIESEITKLLFDVGQTDIFSTNAEYDNVNLSDVDYLVLSHGHYDHTGGVLKFRKINTKAPIYIHPSAMKVKEHIKGLKGENCDVGIQWIGAIDELLKSQLVCLTEQYKICDDFFLSGEIEAIDEQEINNKGLFFKNENGEILKDDFIDEQFLIVRGSKGLYIFLGCSHRGVINSIKHAKKIFPKDSIEAIVGGMHLEQASIQQINKIISGICEQGVKKVFPLHCTGVIAAAEFKRIFKDSCYILNSGDEFLLED